MSEQDERLGEHNGQQDERGTQGQEQKNAMLLLLTSACLQCRVRGARGPQGNQGNRGAPGQRGQRGLSLVQGRAVVFLFVLSVLLSASSWFWIAHEVNSTAAAQQQAGQLVERKLCATLGKLAVLKPPPGNPAANPSRAYEQELHATLDQLGPDLGCGTEGKP